MEILAGDFESLDEKGAEMSAYFFFVGYLRPNDAIFYVDCMSLAAYEIARGNV